MNQSTEENTHQPTERNTNRCKKKSKINVLLKKALVVWGILVIIVLMGWTVLMGLAIWQQKISAENGDIIVLIINRFTLLLLLTTFLPAVIIFGSSLVSEKIQAGVTKQESKDKAEIKKLKLDICKIRCERKLVESKNKHYELQKKNHQSASKN